MFIDLSIYGYVNAKMVVDGLYLSTINIFKAKMTFVAVN